MPGGPGRYDDLCTYVRDAVGAEAAVVLLVDAVDGPGFSVQAPLHILAELPKVLRMVADQMEADYKKLFP